MRRRSRESDKQAKTRRRKAKVPKRGSVPPRQRSTSAAEQLARERDEALKQLSAASEVFKIISSSPGNLQPVFQAILENAIRLCDAKFGGLNLYDGEVFHRTASTEVNLREQWWRPYPGGGAVEVVRTKQPVQINDVRTLPAYRERDPNVRAIADIAGARTLLLVPMLKNVELIGMIGIYRKEVRPFTDKQTELVQNFAAQAVIAIENTRLLNELRQSLDQQTATADVLRVISSWPGELERVFQALLENATRLCEAKFGLLHLYENEAFQLGAMHNAPPAFAQAIANADPLTDPAP